CVDPIEAAHWWCRLSRHTIGGVGIVFVEQLAHQQPALQPPLIEIDQQVWILRRTENELASLFNTIALPQPLHVSKDVAGLAARGCGYRIEQRLYVSGLAKHGCARAANREIVAAEPLGCAQTCGNIFGVEALLHAILVIGGAEPTAEHFKHAFFHFRAGIIVTPGVAHQSGCALAIPLREQQAREHVTSLGGDRLLSREERTYRAIVDPIVP